MPSMSNKPNYNQLDIILGSKTFNAIIHLERVLSNLIGEDMYVADIVLFCQRMARLGFPII